MLQKQLRNAPTTATTPDHRDHRDHRDHPDYHDMAAPCEHDNRDAH